MNKQSKIKPLAKGSSKVKGNISDNALSRITEIPKPTLITWSKQDKNNWRYKHYWFLKSMTEEELKVFIEKSKEFTNL